MSSWRLFNFVKLYGQILSQLERTWSDDGITHLDTLDNMIDEIETVLQNSLDREVSSEKIGELVMDKLKAMNDIAYVRFASVYREFKDVNTFLDELNSMLHGKE